VARWSFNSAALGRRTSHLGHCRTCIPTLPATMRRARELLTRGKESFLFPNIVLYRYCFTKIGQAMLKSSRDPHLLGEPFQAERCPRAAVTCIGRNQSVMMSLDQSRRIQNSTEVSAARLRQLRIGTFVARMASPARAAGEDDPDHGGGGGQHRALDLVAEVWVVAYPHDVVSSSRPPTMPSRSSRPLRITQLRISRGCPLAVLKLLVLDGSTRYVTSVEGERSSPKPRTVRGKKELFP
jgi:hypothetical protein